MDKAQAQHGSRSIRVKRALGLALLYPLLFPTPAFWILFFICRMLGFWTDFFYIGLVLAALGVPAGIAVGFVASPEEKLC